MPGGSHFDSPAPDTDLPWFEDQRVYGEETVIQFEALFTSMLRERTNQPTQTARCTKKNLKRG